MIAAATTIVHAKEGVILLHGLARTSRCMDRMAKAFTAEGYIVVNVDYPSRTMPIRELAPKVIGDALADPRLSDCTRVHFVAHSLGCILVRCYFSDHSDPRLGRVVMLGPPNGGSEVVDRLRNWWLFKKINGPAGAELGTGDDSVPRSLGPVTYETGVIAGDRSINWINSLMIPGPDDGKVSVEHTKVAGMKEHLVLHATHPFLMRSRQAIQATLRFVRTGSFAPNEGPAQLMSSCCQRKSDAQAAGPNQRISA